VSSTISARATGAPWLPRVPELFAGMLALSGLAVVVYKAPGWHRAGIGLLAVALLAAIAAEDLRSMRAPNRLVYPGLVVCLLGALSLGPGAAVEALLGGLAAFALFLVLAAVGRGAMGLGDVKVASLCGVFVGLQGVVPLLFWTFLSGVATAVVLLLLRKKHCRDSVPFTPFLAVGALAASVISPLYLWG
jgi:prepilin signal peptidase PulO-like enzyme (type II secretory pathway)